MTAPNGEAEALKLGPVQERAATLLSGKRKGSVYSYKVALLLYDLLVLNLSFRFAVWLNGFFAGGISPEEINSLFFLFLSSLILIAFFPSYKLYSYHVIFFSKRHVSTLIQSMGWGLFSIGFVFVFCRWPAFLDSPLAIALIISMCLAFVLLSRVFWFQLLDLIKALGFSFLAIGFIGIVGGDHLARFIVNRTELILPLLLGTVLLLISRHLLVNVVLNNWMPFGFRRQITVVGSDEEATKIAEHIIEHNAPFWVAGFVGVLKPDSVWTSVPKEALGELRKLPEIVREKRIDEIIVTDKNINKARLVSLLDYCTSEGLTVWFPPKLLPIINLKLHIDNFCGLDMIRLCTRKKSHFLDIAERGLDLLIALPMFLVFLPFFLITAVAVKLNSAGPVFYRARAIGRHGKEFTLYKFRSMTVQSSSESHKDFVTKLIKGEIRKEEQENGVLKITEDARVTRVGHFLRKYSLDEIPQVINVLKGDMSLVGPRPCLPYEYKIYKDWYKKRTIVRPGISGLWQVAGRSDVVFEDMILLDLYYIYNRSLLMYMNILYETIFAVLEKRGAY